MIIYKQIKDFRVGSWIHVDMASMEDLKKITELTNLKIEDIQDSLDKYEIPRIEQINEKTTIIFIRYPGEEESNMYTSTLTIILTPLYIITISPHKSLLVDGLIQFNKIKFATTQKSKLLFYILLKLTNEFTYQIKNVRTLVINQNKKIQNINNTTIINLTKNEEILNQYLSTLVPLRGVFEKITSGRHIDLYEKDKDLLQDLLIAIKQLEDVCRVNIKSIKSLRDAYQIIFTNDVNKTIKLLTAITIIFTIPTIVSSIYGMNVSLPFANNPFAFLIIINFTIFISIICFLLFIKKKWI